MTPREARRLVGHCHALAAVERGATGGDPSLTNHEWRALRSEIERLRTALRAVRACTDPVWAAQIVKDALREET